jgi:hypothetical protein
MADHADHPLSSSSIRVLHSARRQFRLRPERDNLASHLLDPGQGEELATIISLDGALARRDFVAGAELQAAVGDAWAWNQWIVREGARAR